jgi:hypothetical protein
MQQAAMLPLQEGDAPSRHRLSYDERRAKERKRMIVVVVVTFAVVFLLGAGVLAFLSFRGGRAAALMSAHSASN